MDIIIDSLEVDLSCCSLPKGGVRLLAWRLCVRLDAIEALQLWKLSDCDTCHDLRLLSTDEDKHVLLDSKQVLPLSYCPSPSNAQSPITIEG